MRLVYFGSPDFSAEILESLIRPSGSVLADHLQPQKQTARTDPEGRYKVVGVVTSPDQPVGRHKVMTPSPVALMAQKYDLPVFKPERLDDTNLAHIRLLKPDIFLVISYGKIIPKNWLATHSIGCFNIHFSLLPKYRGALAISEAIRNQDEETGVTLMVIDEQLDHGPIISQSKVSIDINDNVATLTKKLTQAAINLLADYLPKLPTTSSPQNDSLAIYTPQTKSRIRDSAFIPWETIKNAMAGTNAHAIHALIRSLNPDPGAWTTIPSLRGGTPTRQSIEIKIVKTKLDSEFCHLIPELVQLPGRSPISWQQFIAGHTLPPTN